MPAELLAHGGQDAVGEQVLVAGGEAGEQGGRKDRSRYALVDGRDRGPAPLAGVGHPAGETIEVGVN